MPRIGSRRPRAAPASGHGRARGLRGRGQALQELRRHLRAPPPRSSGAPSCAIRPSIVDARCPPASVVGVGAVGLQLQRGLARAAARRAVRVSKRSVQRVRRDRRRGARTCTVKREVDQPQRHGHLADELVVGDLQQRLAAGQRVAQHVQVVERRPGVASGAGRAWVSLRRMAAAYRVDRAVSVSAKAALRRRWRRTGRARPRTRSRGRPRSCRARPARSRRPCSTRCGGSGPGSAG